MPTVLLRGYRLFFFLNEHEPIHIHVTKASSEDRFVLVPEIDMTYCRGFKKNELRDIVNLITEHYGAFIDAWHATFGQ
jgi:Domain of unknown function (DUF4160)